MAAPDVYSMFYSLGGMVLGGGIVHFFKRSKHDFFYILHHTISYNDTHELLE